MSAWRCILDNEVMHRVSRIVSAIKIYDTLERSSLKIHRRVFVSCSRAKGCNFCGLLTFCSETFLEKRSPLNALRNYGDRWGKLRRVTKHKSHPVASLRWLARKRFFWPIRSRQFKRFWNWFGKSKCPGARLDLTENFHHEHFIDPTNCPWVSEDGFPREESLSVTSLLTVESRVQDWPCRESLGARLKSRNL